MSHPAVKEARTEIPQIAAPDAVAGKPHADHNEEHEESHGLDWIEVGRVLFVAAAAVAIWFLRGTSVPYRDVNRGRAGDPGDVHRARHYRVRAGRGNP